MASKIGEVLEIETADSYIKRPAGPMITIELKDISKLPGYIQIPSMAEGAETNDMIAQRSLYFGLLNQCRKCRRFGHHARSCTTNRSKPWEGVTPPTRPLSTNVPDGKQSEGRAPQPKHDQGGRPSRPQKAKSTQTRTQRNSVNSETLRQLEHPTDPTIDNCSDKLLRADSQPRSSSQA
jgi:hypothetical protein